VSGGVKEPHEEKKGGEAAGGGPSGISNALLKRALRGEREAMEALCEALRRRAYRMGLGALRDRDLAEDYAQEVMLRFVKSRGSLRDEQAFLGWFQQLEKHCLADFHRQRKSGMRLSGGETDDGGPEIASGGDGEGVIQSMMDVVHVLDRIPAKYRQLYDLLYVRGLNSKEAAVILGISSSTVRMRKTKLLRILASHLGD